MTDRDLSNLSGQHLTFCVGGDEYAVPILRVREILELRPLTRVPSTPAFIRGVMNVRGSVVPVIDVAMKFRVGETAVTRWTCVVLVEVTDSGEPVVVGIMADSVREVIDLHADDIEAPPEFGTRLRVDFLRGMAKVPGGAFVLMMDLDRVLSAEELALVAESDSIDTVPAGEGSRAEGPPAGTDSDAAIAPNES